MNIAINNTLAFFLWQQTFYPIQGASLSTERK